jgi:hypothetical protein
MLISFPAVPTSQVTTYNDLQIHIQKQLFTGGLKESIRVEVLKAQSAMLMDSLKEASKVELILKKPVNRLFAIDETDDDEHETDLVEDKNMVINQRHRRMGKRPIRGRRNNFGGNNNSQTNDIKCYNCNKLEISRRTALHGGENQFDQSKMSSVNKKMEDDNPTLSTQFRNDTTWIFGRGRDQQQQVSSIFE